MADIVERLRNAVGGPVYDELREAADEIERLRKDLAYWEHIGRDKLDVELMRGLAADEAAAADNIHKREGQT